MLPTLVVGRKRMTTCQSCQTTAWFSDNVLPVVGTMNGPSSVKRFAFVPQPISFASLQYGRVFVALLFSHLLPEAQDIPQYGYIMFAR
jgi:hypothetical protein